MSVFLHYVVLFSAYAVLWFLCLFCLLPVGLGRDGCGILWLFWVGREMEKSRHVADLTSWWP